MNALQNVSIVSDEQGDFSMTYKSKNMTLFVETYDFI